MNNLLQINSSVFSQGGQSTQLANQYVERFIKTHPGVTVTLRDLSTDPVPHLDGNRVGALFTPADKRNADQQAVVDFSDKLIAELQAADTIVLAVPMYNFAIPSTLKAYFDHIARAGVTFHYTETGVVGHLTGKKVVVFAARGGKYEGTPKDTQTTYIRDFLGFLGMTDVSFVYAEGLAMGDEAKEASLEQARAKASQLAA